MQHTIRNVPDYLDAILRSSAQKQGKSLNEVTLAALVRGLSEAPRKHRELADVAGSWRKDSAFDSAIAAQDTAGESIWP